MSVLPTFAISVMLLISSVKELLILQYFQVFLIIIASITTVILTLPGTLTGTLFILLLLVLAYQYGFFATFFRIKIGTAMGIYGQSGSRIPIRFYSYLKRPAFVPLPVSEVVAIPV